MTIADGREAARPRVLRRRRGARRKVFPYLLLIPAAILTTTFLAYPLLVSLILSLRPGRRPSLEWDGAISLEHYIAVLGDPRLMQSLGVTVAYVAGTVLPALVLGLITALLLNKALPLRRMFQSLILLPWAIPGVIVAVGFLWILDSTFGILNFILVSSGVSSEPIGWFTDPNWAMAGVLMPTVWKTYPLFTIVILAALQAIPEEFYEAATVDGASPWQRFRFITMPGIQNAVVLASILTALSSFREFDFIYPLTGGGPVGATETLAVRIYNEAFRFYRFEDASALGIITFLLSIAFVAVTFSRLRNEYF